MSVVMAFSRRPDASLRDIVRTGAVDLLQLPVDDKELAEAAERGIELAGLEPSSSPAAVAVTTGASPPPDGPGPAYTISPAPGGCAKTLYAPNHATLPPR